MSEKTDNQEKKINIPQVVKYLNFAFARASSNVKGRAEQFVNSEGKLERTKLCEYQVEFCYMIDAIERGPVYMVPKIIQDANKLITAMDNDQS